MNWEQDRQEDHVPMMAEMNLTPLIDVLLALVVMLLVTIFPTWHTLNLHLCQDDVVFPAEPCRYIGPEKIPPRPAPGEILEIAIDFDGTVKLNGAEENLASLDQALAKAGSLPQASQPEVYVNPHPLVEYKYVIAVMATAERNGVGKLSLPPGRGAFRKPEPLDMQQYPICRPLPFWHEYPVPSWFDRFVRNPFHDGPDDDGASPVDLVTYAVSWLLLVMGVASYVILVVQGIALWRMARNIRGQRADSLNLSPSLQTGHAEKTGLFRQIAESSLAAAARYGFGTLGHHIPRDKWISGEIRRAQSDIRRRMRRGTIFLASVASTAPFIGLFGTVWGIHCVLAEAWIYASGDTARLAGPIGEALVTTGLGLAVAVPALIGFNLLAGCQARIMAEVKAFSTEMWIQMLAQAR